MSRSGRDEPNVPKVSSPTDKTSTVLIGAGVAMIAASAISPSLLAVSIPAGAVFAALGWRQRVFGRAVVRTHAALQAITRGQMEEAEAHLGAIPSWMLRGGSVMRSVAYQRALVAFYRSDAPAAVAMLEPAASTQTRAVTHNYERMQRCLALSLRALSFASMGEAERARTDIAEVQRSEHATPEALARSRLAEAVVLARAGATDDLAALFRAHASLMLEHAFPRERVLARALRKMVQTKTRSVYREPAKPDDAAAAGAGTIGAWIAGIAPDAAAHATEGTRLAERAGVAPPAPAREEDLRALQHARAEGAKASNRARARLRVRVAVLWSVIAVLVFVIYQLLDTDGASPTSAPPPMTASEFTHALVLGVPLLFFAVLVVAVVFAARRGRKVERDVLAAQRAMALGDTKSAEPLLAELEKTTQGVGSAQALLLRAKDAEQHARFDECLHLCDRALGAIAAQPKGVRVVASLALTPSIAALRGAALAAMGREREANAELVTIAREHVTWSHRATSELRIRLLLAVRRGDLDAARAIARERTPEMPIPLRDEALADLLLATSPHGASRDEQERVDAELREDPVLRGWVDAVAPGLRDELARRVAGGPRVAADAEAREPLEEDEPLARAELSSRS